MNKDSGCFIQNKRAITSIIGTMLLLAIAVTLFSTVYYFVLNMDATPATPAVNVIGGITDENEIVLTHYGGKSINPGNYFLITVDNNQSYVPIDAPYLIDSNNNSKWDLGESIQYTPSDIKSDSQIEITLIDSHSNSITMTSTINRGNVLEQPFVFTKSPTHITATTAMLHLTYNFRDYEGSVQFEYKKSGEAEWDTVGTVDRSGSGSFSFELSSLEPNTEYVFFANLTYDETNILQGEILSFHTREVTLETEIDDILYSPDSPNSIEITAISNGDATPENVTLYYRYSTDNWMEVELFNRSNATARTSGGTSYSNAEETCHKNSPNGEEHDKAFDDNTDTKWLDFCGEDGTSWIQYDYGPGNSYKIAKYSISSANDAPARDPKDWFLEGSNDNNTWIKIDRRTNVMFTSRLETLTFNVSDQNVSTYRWYRLNITDIKNASSANSVQLSEIELYECEQLTNEFSTDWIKYNDGANPDTNPPWNWNFDFPYGPGYYDFYSLGLNESVSKEEPPLTADASIYISFDNFPNNPGNYTGDQDGGELAYGLHYQETPDTWSLGLRNDSGAHWKRAEPILAETNDYSQIIVFYDWSTIGFKNTGNNEYNWTFEYYNDSLSDWHQISKYTEGVDFNNNGNNKENGWIVEWINKSKGFDFSDQFNVRFVCHANTIKLKDFDYQLSIDNIYIIAVRK